MKIILIAILAFSFTACNKDNSTEVPEPKVQEVKPLQDSTQAVDESTMPSDEEAIIEDDEEVIEVDDAPEAPTEIVEENTECICTKDFRPVCGANGQTYPNSCQAECDGMTDYKEGSCE